MANGFVGFLSDRVGSYWRMETLMRHAAALLRAGVAAETRFGSAA
jgi:hypothetical protein